MSPTSLLRLALCLAATGACSAERGPKTAEEGPDAAPDVEIVVSAAASLTDAFAEIESAFEAANPGIEITLNLAGSATLRAQILEGAPVDVFVSADPTDMELVAESGALLGEARLFAGNRLQIVTPRRNPAEVRGLRDLGREELLVGLCRREVPCGRLAHEVLRRSGVTPSIDTAEPDVRALLTKVTAGELDAGITYATDVVAAGEDVHSIDIPEDVNAVTHYPIAVLARSGEPVAAGAFVEFVLSPRGSAILRRNGFLPS